MKKQVISSLCFMVQAGFNSTPHLTIRRMAVNLFPTAYAAVLEETT